MGETMPLGIEETRIVPCTEYGQFRRDVRRRGGRIVKSSICGLGGDAAYAATVRWTQ